MTSAKKEAVGKVIELYMEGTYQGDVEKLRACFHPSAVMNGYLVEDLLVGTPEPFFQDIGGNPSMASGNLPYKGTILSMEVEGRIASVTLKEEGFPGDLSFIDYFHLINTDGGWKIISKTFTTIDS